MEKEGTSVVQEWYNGKEIEEATVETVEKEGEGKYGCLSGKLSLSFEKDIWGGGI